MCKLMTTKKVIGREKRTVVNLSIQRQGHAIPICSKPFYISIHMMHPSYKTLTIFHCSMLHPLKCKQFGIQNLSFHVGFPIHNTVTTIVLARRLC